MKNGTKTGRAIGTMDECLQKIRKELGHTITNYTENGKCSRCGGCCSTFLPLLPGEKDAIKDYLTSHGITEPQNHAAPGDKGTIIDMLCPFLHMGEDGFSSCTIYEARPKICRIFRCNKRKEAMTGEVDEKEKFTIVHVGEAFFPSYYNTKQLEIAKQIHGRT